MQKTHFRPKETHKLKIKGWKKIFHAKGSEKKAREARLISDKIDFKTKMVKRDRECYYIMTKRLTH